MTLRVHPDEIVARSSSPLLAKHESWERVRLQHVADVLNGFAFKSSYFSQDEGVPLIRIRDVGRSATQTRYTGDYDPRYLVDTGTIVLGMDGDFRTARWRGPRALLNQRVCTINVRDAGLYDEDFLLYVLPGYLDAIHGWTSSITVKHLSSETIKEIPLPLPPLAEQRRIVAAIEEHLSRVDSGVAQLTALVARTSRLEAAAFRRAFEFASASAHAAVSLQALVVDARIGLDRGRSAQSMDATGRYPYVRMQDITNDGRLEWERVSYVAASPDERERFSLMSGDLLFNTRNSRELVGKLAPVVDPPRGALYNNNLMRLRFIDDADPMFVWAMMRSPMFQRRLDEVKRTTTNVAAIYARDLLRLQIPVPSTSVQRDLVRALDRQLSLMRSLRRSAAIARQRGQNLRASILLSAFRGDLVPQDSNDEPASVLLERTAAKRAAAPKLARTT